MPDFGMIAGGPSDVGSLATSSTGITLTSDAAAHTKGAWAELIASTAHETVFVVVTITDTAATSGFVVDIGVGASTAEQVLIPNLYHKHGQAAQPVPRVYSLPLAIPTGTRVSARVQCTAAAGQTIKVGIQCFSGPITAQHGLRRVEHGGLTITTGSATSIQILTDPGAVAHTDSTWQELLAATTFAWQWLCVAGALADTATAAITAYLLDLAVGAGGSEVAVVNDLWFLSHTGVDCPVPGTYCFPCAIASGSRIAARTRCSVATAGDRQINAAIYGVG